MLKLTMLSLTKPLFTIKMKDKTLISSDVILLLQSLQNTSIYILSNVVNNILVVLNNLLFDSFKDSSDLFVNKLQDNIIKR